MREDVEKMDLLLLLALCFAFKEEVLHGLEGSCKSVCACLREERAHST